MRVVLQRVKSASVTVEEEIVGEIQSGFVLLIGFTDGDTEEVMQKVANKILSLRILEDENGKMNLSLDSTKDAILAISQFTLYADVKKGRRPSFTKAMEPQEANRLYEAFCEYVEEQSFTVAKGIFGEDMDVQLINDGPVTIVVDSDEL